MTSIRDPTLRGASHIRRPGDLHDWQGLSEVEIREHLAALLETIERKHADPEPR